MVRSLLGALVVLAVLVVLSLSPESRTAHAANFTPGTVAQLIADIDTANTNGEDDVIDLGGQTFTLTAVSDTPTVSGLPPISEAGFSLTIRNGTIERSSAMGTPEFRIVHVANAGNLILEDVTISGGATPSGYDGGGLQVRGTATVLNSTIRENTAPNSIGGGISVIGVLNLVNVTVSGNTAGNAAIWVTGTANLTNVSIVDNVATFSGGDRGILLYPSAIANLTSTLLAGNVGEGSNCTVLTDFIDAGIVSGGYNLSDDASCTEFFDSAGDQNNVTDARDFIGDLADNGGPTQTHALLEGSTAIDGAGDCDLDEDQRGEPRPVDGNGIDGAQCDIGAFEVQAPEADLSVTKTGPETIEPGQDISYTLTVTNNGPDEHSGTVFVSDVVPIGTALQSVSGPGWVCLVLPATPSCTWNDGVAADTSLPAITLVTRVLESATEGTIYTNVASVTGEILDPNPDNNIDTVETTVVVPEAGLGLSKTVDRDTAGAGVDLTYTITLTNDGPDDAENAVLEDNTPAGTTFQSLTAPAGWTCITPAVGATGLVSCSIDSLEADAQAVFTLTVRIDNGVAQGTVITNTAAVSSDTLDPETGDNEATATTAIGEARLPRIIVRKSASPFAAVQGGSVFFYVSVYKLNFGNVTLVGLDDSAFGDLNGKGSCATGVAIGPLGYHCAFAETIDFGGSFVHKNVVTATGANSVGQETSASDDAVVLRIDRCRFIPVFCR